MLDVRGEMSDVPDTESGARFAVYGVREVESGRVDRRPADATVGTSYDPGARSARMAASFCLSSGRSLVTTSQIMS